jgi:hypothetical protein
VRCDRQNPCSHCSKGGLECAFPVSGRTPTRRHDQIIPASSRQKQTELLTRLRRLEGILGSLGIQDGEEAGQQIRDPVGTRPGHLGTTTMAGRHPTPPLKNEEPPSQQIAQEFGRLIVSDEGTTYVGNHIWNFVIDEVRPWAI